MKNLFLSYAKADAARLALLHDGIEALHHNLWMDRHLDAGHVWWEDILEQIRNCDAMIVAVSPALLESEAASRERSYARQLGKPLLPVMVA
ncbi:toll/interleukin-1 receptor domain-containing protein, partial [Escherichia coli]|uniref:toll/interleukin-1 receptor domain-containing protein n=1 Tax=Escherichia coli TaxID=562 RepID=UPI0032E3FD33